MEILNKGKDVSLDDVGVNDARLLTVEGDLVAVYIRDQNPEFTYRFHIAQCKTLDQMTGKGRSKRYVASRDPSGTFRVNLQGVEERVELMVCKNCLDELDYQGFRKSSGPMRVKIRDEFSLKEFIEHSEVKVNIHPDHDESTAPINVYAENWNEISQEYRAKNDWKCEHCRIDLAKHRAYLHVHHIDGEKSNNLETNLLSLCIGCHAEQPGHEHMMRSLIWKQFRRRFKKQETA
jgi:hypothetical protein